MVSLGAISQNAVPAPFPPRRGRDGHDGLLRCDQLFEFGGVPCGSRTTRRRGFSSSGAGPAAAGLEQARCSSLPAISFRMGIGQWLRIIPGTGTLAKATNCCFYGYICRKWIKFWAVRTGMPHSLMAGTQVPYGSFSMKPQQCVILQSSLFDSAPGRGRSRILR